MALTTSGTISLGDIRTEFNIVGEVSFGACYRGGNYVTQNNINVPTNGAISFNQFYYNSTTGNGLKAIQCTAQPYKDSSIGGFGFAFFNSVVYKKVGSIWQKLSDSTNFNPCGSGYTADYNNLLCSRTVSVSSGWQNRVSDCGGTYNVPVDGYYHRGYFRFSMHNGRAGSVTDMHSHQGCPSIGTGWLQGSFPYGPGAQIHGINHNCTCPAWNSSYEIFSNVTENIVFSNA